MSYRVVIAIDGFNLKKIKISATLCGIIDKR